MPCEQKRIIGIEIAKMEADLLQQAIRESQPQGRVWRDVGKLYGEEQAVQTVVKKYAELAIKKAAKRQGWKIDQKEPHRLTLRR